MARRQPCTIKAFLFLLVIASLFSVFDLVGIAYAAISRPAIISLVVHIIKIAALLVLVFKKDLGKRRAWIAFQIGNGWHDRTGASRQVLRQSQQGNSLNGL